MWLPKTDKNKIMHSLDVKLESPYHYYYYYCIITLYYIITYNHV